MNDFRGKCVLITGGTMGIGLATALAFGRQGASVVLTNKWGTADEDELRGRFSAEGLKPPRIVSADAGHDGDTDSLLTDLRKDFGAIEVFVSNVAMALIVRSLEDYERKALLKSIEYTAWPLFGYTRRIHEIFGKYPRYVIGLSSPGPDHFHANYDFVAASKALMEVLCRYLNYRLFSEDVRINILRAWAVGTESFRATFGPEIEDLLHKVDMHGDLMEPREAADAILALCSGLMDGVSGQVLTVDRGTTFRDNLMGLFSRRDALKF